MVRRLAGSLAVLVAVLVAVDAALLAGEPDRWRHVALTAALVAAIATALGASRVTRARSRWASYRVVVTDDAIRREVSGARPLEIARGEAIRVAEGPQGLLVVAADRQVGVPRELDAYDAMREALLRWADRRA